jgi:rhodanese-related sulfurtransferase
MTPRRRIALAIGIVALLGTGFSLAFAFPEVFAPARSPAAPMESEYEPLALTPAEVKARMDRGEPLLIADVRGKTSYEAKHITGARSMPASESSSWGPGLDPGVQVVFYCSCPDDGASIATVRLAEDHYGFKNGAVLKGGLKAWEAAGYPLTLP